jgi:Rrf2 family protein
MISRKGLYAIRTSLFLARKHGGQPVSVEEIATEEGISKKFLEGIMHDLKKAGVVHSHRGKRGGYTLAEGPRELTVGKVVRAIDGHPVSSGCAFERCEDCPGESGCLVRAVIREVSSAIHGVLDLKSIEELVRQGQIASPALMYDI